MTVEGMNYRNSDAVAAMFCRAAQLFREGVIAPVEPVEAAALPAAPPLEEREDASEDESEEGSTDDR